MDFNHQILSLSENHVQALSNLAIIYRLQDNYQEAEVYWGKVIGIKPSYSDAIEQLIAILAAQNRHNEAIDALLPVLTYFSDRIYRSLHDWSRFLNLYHTLGNLYSATNNYILAAKTFSTVILLASNCVNYHQLTLLSSLGVGAQNESYSSPRQQTTIPEFISFIYNTLMSTYFTSTFVLPPKQALDAKYFIFPPNGLLPLPNFTKQHHHHRDNNNRNSLDTVVSNSLLNLAKIIQDGVNSGVPHRIVYINGKVPSHYDIFALYLLSLSFNPSPSTANNMGILLASLPSSETDSKQFALEYYRYGLSLDPKHPHLYTNLGSLLREQGKIEDAIQIYQKAVQCDDKFNIALANLASALKDQGQVDQAVVYYRKAVKVTPDFVEALSGLANCQGTVCDWLGRGGYGWEPVSVDEDGTLVHGQIEGWLPKVVSMIDNQIDEARNWGVGLLDSIASHGKKQLFNEVERALGGLSDKQRNEWLSMWNQWRNKKDEGSKVLEMIEKLMRVCQRRWYLDKINGNEQSIQTYCRPQIPSELPIPLATTILPFHAFTLPFNADQLRNISEKSAARVSMTTLLQPWVPEYVYPPPQPPLLTINESQPQLVVGYVSSDFVNHPLAHLMQSVFEMHNRSRVLPICYATSPSDGSAYRSKIEEGSYKFRDVSALSTQEVADQIVSDGVHVLVNLNGFTRGARNEIFAVRPAPIQVALMGFAGPIGGVWCDYILGDKVAISPEERSVYKERIIYMPRSLFCCDHRQSCNDSNLVRSRQNKDFHTWEMEKQLRQDLRQKMFPQLPDNALLMANFNQLYKIDPTTWYDWLVVLEQLPHAYLWLLQFPKSGEDNLMKFAQKWCNDESVLDRIIFTPVAEKDLHIFRARVCDIFLDTPECNAHTTAADVMWTGTPIVTYPRHKHKLCSRIGASIVQASFPDTPEGIKMADRLIVSSEEEYRQRIIELCKDGKGCEELSRMREVLFKSRETGDFFDTQKWVYDLETGFSNAWNDWVTGKHRDVYLE